MGSHDLLHGFHVFFYLTPKLQGFINTLSLKSQEIWWCLMVKDIHGSHGMDSNIFGEICHWNFERFAKKAITLSIFELEIFIFLMFKSFARN